MALSAPWRESLPASNRMRPPAILLEPCGVHVRCVLLATTDRKEKQGFYVAVDCFSVQGDRRLFIFPCVPTPWLGLALHAVP